MRHIYKDAKGYWTFDRYFAYLETVRAELPEAAYQFAAKFEHYSLESHTSMHDAWLERFTLHEVAEADGSRSLRIETIYLGAYHDYRIRLNYRGVEGYSLSGPEQSEAPSEAGHGDLLLHEVRLVRPGLCEHELEFASGAVFVIRFQDIEHTLDAVG
jgi:hypothetical protein